MLRDEVLDNAVSTYAFKFSSKWWDAETGWSYYGRRYYDARMGRFVGRDPIGEEGGINLYAFVRNNPVDRWDMLGMEDPVTFDPFEYLASLPENLRNDLQLRLATNTGLADWFFGGQGSYFDDEGDEMNLGNLFGDGSMNLMYDGIASGTIDSFGVSNAMIAGRQLDLLAEAARNLQVPNSGGLAAIGKASQFGTGTLLKPGAVPEVDAMLTNDNVVNQLGVLYGLNQNYGIQQNGGNVSVTEFFATINGTSATSNTLYGNTITLSSTDFDAGGWTASVTPRFTMVDLTAVAHTHPINGVPSDGHDFAFQLPVLSSSGVWSIIVTPSNVYFTGPQQGQYYYLPASDFINAGKANNTTVTIPAQPLPGP
ncbi:MAG: RHS repeat-associated core domain-containing protein [Opitutaceae bacterium]|nr:RHS repeat-associated core domain-containing protein [Opitutaceae bacterium]